MSIFKFNFPKCDCTQFSLVRVASGSDFMLSTKNSEASYRRADEVVYMLLYIAVLYTQLRPRLYITALQEQCVLKCLQFCHKFRSFCPYCQSPINTSCGSRLGVFMDTVIVGDLKSWFLW